MGDSVKYWKTIAFAAVGMYVYKAVKARGGTLKGNPYGINLNSDRVVDHVMLHLPIHPNIKPMVEAACKKVAKQMLDNSGYPGKMRDVGPGGRK